MDGAEFCCASVRMVSSMASTASRKTSGNASTSHGGKFLPENCINSSRDKGPAPAATMDMDTHSSNSSNFSSEQEEEEDIVACGACGDDILNEQGEWIYKNGGTEQIFVCLSCSKALNSDNAVLYVAYSTPYSPVEKVVTTSDFEHLVKETQVPGPAYYYYCVLRNGKWHSWGDFILRSIQNKGRYLVTFNHVDYLKFLYYTLRAYHLRIYITERMYVDVQIDKTKATSFEAYDLEATRPLQRNKPCFIVPLGIVCLNPEDRRLIPRELMVGAYFDPVKNLPWTTLEELRQQQQKK